jgi:hypothetical protein
MRSTIDEPRGSPAVATADQVRREPDDPRCAVGQTEARVGVDLDPDARAELVEPVGAAVEPGAENDHASPAAGQFRSSAVIEPTGSNGDGRDQILIDPRIVEPMLAHPCGGVRVRDEPIGASCLERSCSGCQVGSEVRGAHLHVRLTRAV